MASLEEGVCDLKGLLLGCPRGGPWQDVQGQASRFGDAPDEQVEFGMKGVREGGQRMVVLFVVEGEGIVHELAEPVTRVEEWVGLHQCCCGPTGSRPVEGPEELSRLHNLHVCRK
eukprot:1786530-Heterocapsa_arctica.AAC.1